MNPNEELRYLCVDLPGDIARRKAGGDLAGAIRLIDRRLAGHCPEELAARLRLERARLERLPQNYPLTRDEAIALLRQEWTDMTEEQFDALVDGGRIDWRYIQGRPQYSDRMAAGLRLYPAEAPGMKQEPADHTRRDQMLARMKEEGELTALITVRAAVRAVEPLEGKRVQAWLPIPAQCPQQSDMEILEATPGCQLAPLDAPQRTIYWESTAGAQEFQVVYRYRHRAVWVDPFALKCDPVQPTFCTGEEVPHMAFTPYLRALAAQVTQGCRTPVEKAAAIYEYVTGHVDYRFQPDYLQLEPIADACARDLRGDCGVMALLFITLCRLNGVPAQWQSGLHVTPEGAGAHDWAAFYVAPYGWLFADPSFGSSARRNGETGRRRHYFGNLDPCRMVANRACLAPLTPPDPALRHDPYDNQLGEMTVDGRGLWGCQMERTTETVEFQLL